MRRCLLCLVGSLTFLALLASVWQLRLPDLSEPVAAADPPARQKVALLVGVNQYDRRGFAERPLSFAERDVEEMAQVLKTHGFTVRLLKGSSQGVDRATRPNIQAALNQLLAGRHARDVVLLGFAGHGQQMPLVNDKGDVQKDQQGQVLEDAFFCPADAVRGEPETMVSLTGLMQTLDRKGGINLVLVDACRDNPDPTRSLRSITGNELNGRLPANTAVVFSCAAGQQAWETTKAGKGHGVFFYHVLEGLRGEAKDPKTGDVTWSRLVEYVTDRTNEQAKEWFPDVAAQLKDGQLQTPHELRNLIGRPPVLARIARATIPEPIPRVRVPETSPSGDSGGAVPRAKKEIETSLGSKLVLIPAGTFEMGSPNSETGSTYEQQHRVRITKPFYLGKYEVTQGEWKAVMGTEPWKGKAYVKEGDDYPATYVSWEDAVEFCKKLSKKEGKEYRLPTEAEWEYACRGGKTTRFHFGNDESDLGEYAWFDKNAWDAGDKYAHRVGQKKANPFGLHDMHGNVWEWCSDWYGEKHYASSPTNDPQGPETGSNRVNRGGSWNNGPVDCRSALRNGFSPSYRDGNLGFRLARSSRE